MNQHLRPEPVPFIDVAAQRRRLGKSIDEAVSRVLAHCQFINGPEVTQLEAALAKFSGAGHVVACASGTDALLMVLMAKGVGPGDAVFCPSFTFCATGEAVALTGATPVFVDVDEATFNIDASSLRRAIATARKAGLKPVAVIPVDLFGQSADHDAIAAVVKGEGLFVLDDAAQGFGAGASAPLGLRPRPASFRQNRSAATAMAARSSPTMPSLRRRCAASAFTARVLTNTTMFASGSRRGSIPCRRRS
jgi:histidinol-phosphate/aromatic aminotransferase/cobyric acid decarboxylase-like protein